MIAEAKVQWLQLNNHSVSIVSLGIGKHHQVETITIGAYECRQQASSKQNGQGLCWNGCGTQVSGRDTEGIRQPRQELGNDEQSEHEDAVDELYVDVGPNQKQHRQPVQPSNVP